MPPREGDEAPDFETLLCTGETFRSTRFADVADEGGVLVFSAFAFSAVAENWWKRYDRAGWADFDVPVVGVSRDGPYAQNAFLRAIDSPFRLFADTDAVAADAYDLRRDRDGMANVSTPTRATFVVDADGRIAYRWVADDWTSPAPREAVEAAVADLDGD
jgi:peroxiredoxin